MKLLKSLSILLAVAAGVALVVMGLQQRAPHLAAIGLCLPFAVTALASPILRRLAIRNSVRRPKETVLILLGSLLGTAIFTSSAVVGDTFAASIRASVPTQLGPVDEVVDIREPAIVDDVQKAIDNMARTDIDGVLHIKQTGGAAGVSGADPRVQRDVQMLEVPFEQASAFGGDPETTGISGTTPAPGHAVVTEDLAKVLRITPGNTIDLYVFGEQRRMIVDRFVPRLGLAGLNLDEDNGASYNVFLAPGSLTTHDSSADDSSTTDVRAFDAVRHQTLVSNRGGVFDGRDLTNTVRRQLDRATQPAADLIPTAQKEARILPAVDIRQVKDDRIRDADDAGRVFSRLFSGIGSFTVIAGVLLLINIFTMLTQERQSELGMLRAIGMRRKSLIGVFSLEGFLYGIGASVMGTAAGFGLGALVVLLASRIFAGVDDEFEFILDAQFDSLAWGFLAGLGVTVLTVVLASLFIARMNVIRAIRELPDNSLHRKRLIGLVLGLLLLIAGALVTVAGVSQKNEFTVLLGPALGAIGLVLTFRRWLPTKWLLTFSSVAVLVWSVIAFTIVKKVFVNANAGVYVLQGVLLTAFAVTLISANQEHIGGLLRRISGSSWSMALRLGLAYPLARRGRTGLLLAMYSLIVFVLTFIITISHVLTTGVARQVAIYTAGIDIELVAFGDEELSEEEGAGSGTGAASIPIETIRQHPDVAKIAPVVDMGALEIKQETRNRTEYQDVVAVDVNYVGNGSGKLSARQTPFASDADAFRSVVASDDLVIVGSGVLRERGEKSGLALGDRVTLRTDESNSSATFTVAGLSSRDSEIVIGNKAAARLFPTGAPPPNRAFIQTKPGADVVRLASQLSGLYFSENIEAHAIQHEIEEGFTVVRQFMLLIQGYLAIGLLVGIAGLGVTMVRAVRERRRQIGMLRAMGFQSRSIRHAFFAEAAFIAGEGILIGASLALVVLARVFTTLPDEIPLDLEVPWLYLGALVATTFGASLLAVAAPARQASMVPPAVALRTVD